jgi:osmoprotectant transport system substrate-binding protein
MVRELALASLVFLGGAGTSGVIVSSKMDTEGSVLGALIEQTLAAHGVPVVDRTELGPTSLVRAALLAGQIDLYPEYTGNGAIFFHRESDPAFRDARAGLALDRKLDKPNGIDWLDPSPADNTWAIAVNVHVEGVLTLADFARSVKDGPRIKLAASSEFVESPQALPVFEHVYDFTLTQDQLLVLSGGDTAATERAAADGISGVNATMAYTTDGALALLPLRLLSDPSHAQTVYAPAPVIRSETLAAHPRIREWLAPVFASLTLPVLQRLNARVAADGVPPARVAHDYLATLTQ